MQQLRRLGRGPLPNEAMTLGLRKNNRLERAEHIAYQVSKVEALSNRQPVGSTKVSGPTEERPVTTESADELGTIRARCAQVAGVRRRNDDKNDQDWKTQTTEIGTHAQAKRTAAAIAEDVPRSSQQRCKRP